MTKQLETHTALYDACQEILRLEQVNAELLEALKSLRTYADVCGYLSPFYINNFVNQTIAKAEVQA